MRDNPQDFIEYAREKHPGAYIARGGIVWTIGNSYKVNLELAKCGQVRKVRQSINSILNVRMESYRKLYFEANASLRNVRDFVYSRIRGSSWGVIYEGYI